MITIKELIHALKEYGTMSDEVRINNLEVTKVTLVEGMEEIDNTTFEDGRFMDVRHINIQSSL